MELKYTPKKIREIEEETGKPVQELLADFSIKTITLFVQKGLGVKEDEAYDAMEKYLAEDKDTFMLYTEIMESLQRSGFLPRQLNLKEMKSKMNNAIEGKAKEV